METEGTGGSEEEVVFYSQSQSTEGSIGKTRIKPSEFSLLSHMCLTELFISVSRG